MGPCWPKFPKLSSFQGEASVRMASRVVNAKLTDTEGANSPCDSPLFLNTRPIFLFRHAPPLTLPSFPSSLTLLISPSPVTERPMRAAIRMRYDENVAPEVEYSRAWSGRLFVKAL